MMLASYGDPPRACLIVGVSARDLQLLPGQIDYLAGKGRDTFLPMGPGIVPRDEVADYRSLAIRLWVNDELRQSATAGEMTRGVEALIAELSRGMTLVPGDIVRTEVEGIGAPVNEIRDVRASAGKER